MSNYEIRQDSYFNCHIFDKAGNQLRGFILARSKEGNAVTVCDMDFQRSDNSNKYEPRPTFRRTFKDLSDKPITSNKKFQRISFQSGKDGYREFWKMVSFILKFKEFIDENIFDDFRVVSTDDIIFSLNDKDDLEKYSTLTKIIEETNINSEEIILLARRKKELKDFERLLNEEGYVEQYYKDHQNEIKGTGEEAVWHYFFKRNKWIFGLSLDYRFMNDLLDEQSVGNPDSTNHGASKVDFIGLNDFTTLIEIKRPDTAFFKGRKSTSRTDTWAFSNDFIDGISQCLAQKEEIIKNYQSKDFVDDNGKKIDKNLVRNMDPKVIFIIGNKQREIPYDSGYMDNDIKRDTLERFTQNNKNLSIISFDELYTRASNILTTTEKIKGEIG